MKNLFLIIISIAIFSACSNNILGNDRILNEKLSINKSTENIDKKEKIVSDCLDKLILFSKDDRLSILDMNGNPILRLINDKIDHSRMKFIFHNNVDTTMLKGISNIDEADISELFVFDPTHLTILVYESTNLKKLVGCIECHLSRGKWFPKWVSQDYMFYVVDRINYHLKQAENDELMAYQLMGKMYYGKKNDKGKTLEHKWPISKEDYLKKKNGEKIDEKVLKIGEKEIKQQLKARQDLLKNGRPELKKVLIK
jgi:hypothetical protein